jgi:ATP-dependent DNA ligase
MVRWWSSRTVELTSQNYRPNYCCRRDKLVFYAFDLLYLNGFDLRSARQIERKAALENLLDGIEAPVARASSYSE